MKRDSETADWTSFFFQFLFGTVVGLFVALAFLRARLLEPRINNLLEFLVLGGAVLFAGGLSSKFGDRLWLGRSAVTLSPKKIAKRCVLQSAVSIVIIVIGLGLILGAVISSR